MSNKKSNKRSVNPNKSYKPINHIILPFQQKVKPGMKGRVLTKEKGYIQAEGEGRSVRTGP